MSTPDFEVHRAIVHYSDPTTGEAQVRIPSLLGAGQTVNIPTTGLTSSDGFWNVPSIGSSTFIAVSVDRTQFLWLTAIGVSGSGGDDPSNEPIGHEDRTGSLMSFNNGTRTFSIQPANGSYVVWCVGLRYEKSTTESVVLPDTTGLYYIYFDPQGVLQYRDSFFVWDQDCPTAYVYWNSATQRAEFFADERHGITMDWQTHEYLHRTRGAAYANGFDASNFDTSTKDGNTDAQAQLDIDNGTFFDEDLQVDVRHSLAPAVNTWEQQLQGPARIPVFYRSGTGYVYDDPTDFPVKQGVTHPVYNSSSGGLWGTTELGANSYGIQWIVATNQLNYPVLSIMGQAQYANVGQAEAASWASMDLSGLPVVEIRVLYKIIFRATGSNTPGCYFDQIDDYRNALSNATSTAAAVVDHGNLTGLGDDDHPQYLTSARGDLLYADINSSPTITLSGDATGSVTLTDLGSGTLSVTVVDDSHTHDTRYYQRDGTYTTSDILTFQSNDNMATSSGSQAALQVYQDTVNADAFMTFHVAGDYAVYFGLDGGINDLAVGGWSMGNVSYRIWHQGNDGSGSGLDADLLDGLQATSFHREGQDISLGGYAVVNGGSGTNTDHFWYSDSSFTVNGNSKGGVWHFCADTSYKATGNSAIRAGGFYGEHLEITQDAYIGNSSSGGNATSTIMAQSGYYAIQYFGDGGTNQWHYESNPGGSTFAFVESGVSQRFVLYAGGGAWVSGYLNKSGGGFRIPHPHPDLAETHDLVHNFVEAPQADNIYRGRVQLVNGTASVNIDTASGMTDGTFVLLNRDIQCFTSNEEGPCGVWGYVEDNILHVTAQHPDCNHTISWMVIGERQDEFMITGTDATDETGKVIVEPLKREDVSSDFVVAEEPVEVVDTGEPPS